MCAQLLSRVQLFVVPKTVACQAPLSMGFPKADYWNELLLPSPGDLPKIGIKPTFLALADVFFTTWEGFWVLDMPIFRTAYQEKLIIALVVVMKIV